MLYAHCTMRVYVEDDVPMQIGVCVDAFCGEYLWGQSVGKFSSLFEEAGVFKRKRAIVAASVVYPLISNLIKEGNDVMVFCSCVVLKLLLHLGRVCLMQTYSCNSGGDYYNFLLIINILQRRLMLLE